MLLAAQRERHRQAKKRKITAEDGLDHHAPARIFRFDPGDENHQHSKQHQQRSDAKDDQPGIEGGGNIGGVDVVKEVDGQKDLEAQLVQALADVLLQHADAPQEHAQQDAQEQRQHRLEGRDQILHGYDSLSVCHPAHYSTEACRIQSKSACARL